MTSHVVEPWYRADDADRHRIGRGPGQRPGLVVGGVDQPADRRLRARAGHADPLQHGTVGAHRHGVRPSPVTPGGAEADEAAVRRPGGAQRHGATGRQVERQRRADVVLLTVGRGQRDRLRAAAKVGREVGGQIRHNSNWS
jgi:hypothetical protein